MKGRAVSVGEEYLLADAHTLRPAPSWTGGGLEAATPAVRDLADLAAAIADSRRRLAVAASAHEARARLGKDSGTGPGAGPPA